MRSSIDGPAIYNHQFMVRDGVEFDQAHPRHHFAKMPQVSAGGSAIQAIDWSSGGMPTQVHSAIIQAGGGRSHASPVALAQAVQPVPLNVMRAEYARAPNYAPTVVKSNAPAPMRVQMDRKLGGDRGRRCLSAPLRHTIIE